MKKILLTFSILTLFFVGGFSLTNSLDTKDHVLPTDKKVQVRGCCSSHRGVDCSKGPTSSGKVICADGWKRSKCSYKKHCG